MWLWQCELPRLGFRQLSEWYWQCERGHGLAAGVYLSIFADAADREPGGRVRLDVAAFHVTMILGVDRVHFYYHEAGEAVWEPGGHTSGAEIRRHRADLRELRRRADAVAANLVAAMGHSWLSRAPDE